MTKGGLLGGVYGYLDAQDRVVVADGSGAIVRVAHRGGLTAPRLVVEDRVSLGGHLPRGDAVTGLAPDYSGRVWFVTTNGVVGTVTPRPNQRSHVASTRLPRGEQMGNGLSVRPQGVSVLTTHALYEMRAGADGVPRTVWHRAYDRGSARKPGQLTWGSGTTPTYFGPGGNGWVAIVDNADAAPNLLVYRSDDGGATWASETTNGDAIAVAVEREEGDARGGEDHGDAASERPRACEDHGGGGVPVGGRVVGRRADASEDAIDAVIVVRVPSTVTVWCGTANRGCTTARMRGR